MPTNVARFEMLMYVSLALSVVITATSENTILTQNRGFAMGILLVTIAFTVLFTWLIARRGANWARWVFAVFFGLGAPFALIAIPFAIVTDPIGGVLSTIQFSVQAIAVVMIFSGDAREWFGGRSAA
jgi:hypothetical protein